MLASLHTRLLLPGVHPCTAAMRQVQQAGSQNAGTTLEEAQQHSLNAGAVTRSAALWVVPWVLVLPASRRISLRLTLPLHIMMRAGAQVSPHHGWCGGPACRLPAAARLKDAGAARFEVGLRAGQHLQHGTTMCWGRG